MPRTPKSQTSSGSTPAPTKLDILAALPDALLKRWAGNAVYSRGWSYQKRKHVLDLGRIGDGMLAAWVQGTARYATFVEMGEDGEPQSLCTCPYETDCKHAVATILEFRLLAGGGWTPAELPEDDPRVAILDRFDEVGVDDEDSRDDDEMFDDEDEETETAATTRESREKRRAGKHPNLPSWMEDLRKPELLGILDSVCAKYPDILHAMEMLRRTKRVKPQRAARVLAREIELVSSEPAWWDGWRGSGSIPDYSGIRAGLAALLERGEADEVLRLGDLLIEKGTLQVGMSNDEGDTATEIASALEPVFSALTRCSLSQVARMLKAHDWESADEYSLCDGLSGFWSRRIAKRDWSAFADALLQRLASRSPLLDPDEFSGAWRRDRFTDRIIHALEAAGRDDEALALCEREVTVTNSYLRLVDALLRRKREDDAEAWIRHGVEATGTGTRRGASSLLERLKEMKSRKRDWPMVASLILDDFLANPSFSLWQELEAACRKAKLWPIVRAGVLQFLATGDERFEKKKDWPLPETGLRVARKYGHRSFPDYSILLRIAIHEEDVPETVRLFAAAFSEGQRSRWGVGLDAGLLNDIAKTVAADHPDTSVGIWNRLAETHIAETRPSSYPPAVEYLRKSRDLLKSKGRLQEWNEYFARLLEKEKRKRRFMELASDLKEGE